MQRKSKNRSGLSALRHGVPKEYIARLIPDPIVVEIPVSDDVIAISPLGENAPRSLVIKALPDQLLAKAVAAAGETGNVITKEHLLAATECDEAMLIEAEHEATRLFNVISIRVGKEAARRIFASVLARPEGRPRKTGLDVADRALLSLNQKSSRREAATIAHKMGLGQSIEANEKRLQRLRRQRA